MESPVRNVAHKSSKSALSAFEKDSVLFPREKGERKKSSARGRGAAGGGRGGSSQTQKNSLGRQVIGSE